MKVFQFSYEGMETDQLSRLFYEQFPRNGCHFGSLIVPLPFIDIIIRSDLTIF
jgi:hypothetical protein